MKTIVEPINPSTDSTGTVKLGYASDVLKAHCEDLTERVKEFTKNNTFEVESLEMPGKATEIINILVKIVAFRTFLIHPTE